MSGWLPGWWFSCVFHKKNAIHPTCLSKSVHATSFLSWAIPKQTGARVEKTKTWSFLVSSHTVWTTWLICPCVHNVLLLHDLWHLHLRLLVLPDVLKGPLKNVKHDTSYDVVCSLCQLSGASRNPKPFVHITWLHASHDTQGRLLHVNPTSSTRKNRNNHNIMQ